MLLRQCWRCHQQALTLNAYCDRHQRFAEVNAKGRLTLPGSPEGDALLDQWTQIHAAVLALAEELEGEA